MRGPAIRGAMTSGMRRQARWAQGSFVLLLALPSCQSASARRALEERAQTDEAERSKQEQARADEFKRRDDDAAARRALQYVHPESSRIRGCFRIRGVDTMIPEA